MKTVLLVEDNPVDVMLLRRALNKIAASSELQTVNDGQAAIDYLAGAGQYSDRSRFPTPYVIVLDLKLPRKSGFEVLRWLRTSSAYPHLPVVVLTSSREDQDLQRAYASGANSYLLKTLNADDLTRMAGILHQYWVEFNQVAGT